MKVRGQMLAVVKKRRKQSSNLFLLGSQLWGSSDPNPLKVAASQEAHQLSI
jgi:hypothetical protein